MHILEVKNLTKIFYRKSWFKKTESFTAVDNISFQVKKGEVLGFLGPNGAGKTTTIQMLLSTLVPTYGIINYFDKDFFKYRSEILKKVGFASTYVKLPSKLTIKENLDIYGRLYGLSKSERSFKITENLKFFDLWHLRDRETGVLSAGETARVMLCKAFLAEPKIVLLDEPTAALDPDIAQEVRNFIIKQKNEKDVSFLLTSHNMAEVTQVCDRVLVLKNGKIIANNTPEELASSIAFTNIELMSNDLKPIIEFLNIKNIKFKLKEHSINIEIEEKYISDLLIDMVQRNIKFNQISIAKPTLEDYFLQVIKQK